jgi:hypothetical protein
MIVLVGTWIIIGIIIDSSLVELLVFGCLYLYNIFTTILLQIVQGLCDNRVKTSARVVKVTMIQNDGLNFVRLNFLNYTRYVDDLHDIWKMSF